jgi:spore coat polysaccharide biosynthesis protein SpsF
MTLAIIIARLTSSRLPKKQLKLINDLPLIYHVIDRLNCVKEIDKTILATGPKSENDELANYVSELGVETYYDNDVNDVTGRIAKAGQFYGADIVVTISGDCPLIDPAIITEGIDLLHKSEAEHIYVDHTKFECLHEGIGFHTLQTWIKLDELSLTWHHKEHPGSVLNEQKDFFKGVEVIPHKDFQRYDFRMSVDTRSDLFFMNEIYKRLSKENEIIDLHKVVKLIDEKPWLKIINSHVHQKAVTEKSNTFLFITHASKGIGMGHLSRSLALATELQESSGMKTIFYINNDPIICKILDEQGFNYHSANQFGDKSEIDHLIDQYGINGIVLDLKKDVLHKYFNFIQNGDVPSVLIDNYPEGPFKDLLAIIPAVQVNDQKLPENIYKGKEFLILKREIQYWRENKDFTSPNGILIMSGGSNVPEDYLLKALMNIDDNISITFIIGPYAEIASFNESLKRMGVVNFNIIQNPVNLFQELKKSKLVILPFGVSTYECLALGIPAYVYNIINLQDEKIVEFLESNNLLFNGLHANPDSDVMAKQINNIYHNYSDLENISNNTLKYIDGLGVYHATEIINQNSYCYVY